MGNLLKNIGLDEESVILEWIKNNTKICKDLTISKVDDKYIVSAQVISFNPNVDTLNNYGLFEWGIIGWFWCTSTQITSLEGAPQRCGKFDCGYCSNLINLEGAPKKCHEFDCSNCKNLKSLLGAPDSCASFVCKYCPELKNLEGGPSECKKFNCSYCENLLSLNGAPLDCDDFDCRGTKNLVCPEILFYKAIYKRFNYFR